MVNIFYIKHIKVFYKRCALSKIDADTFEVVYLITCLNDFNLKAYLKDKTGIWWFEEKN